MRKLKFRVFHKLNKNISYYTIEDFIRLGKENAEDKYFEKLEQWWKDIEISENTGLKDKNGKEIYEGDILQNFKETGKPNRKFIIDSELYENCGCCDSIYGWSTDGNGDCSDCEIIGNIHENSELLEK